MTILRLPNAYHDIQTYHTMNSGSEMVEAKHVSGKNIFWSTLIAKSRGGKIFEFLHCPFEGRTNMHHKIQPNWPVGRCCLAGGSKGQCRKSKNFPPLLLAVKVDQNIFFPETCFASSLNWLFEEIEKFVRKVYVFPRKYKYYKFLFLT